MKKLVLLFVFLIGTLVLAAIELENLKEIRSKLGLDPYNDTERLSRIKIAVIDNGFGGMEEDKKYLPSSTTIVLKYDPEFIKQHGLGDPEYQQGPSGTTHGRVMAQIAWAATGMQELGPKFYLLNANGITNFRRAVRYAIEEKVDIILYSQNRECCGNFDGGGFLNAIVNQATDAGILWVNAAGNYGGRVYNDNVENAVNGKQPRLLSRLDENRAQIILTWNSSGAEEDTGTDKDLDLFLYDENNQVVAKSELKQVFKKAELGEGETFLPRERIQYEFSKNQKGVYRVVVRQKSQNFTHLDRVRLVVIPEKPPIYDSNKKKMVDSLELLDATKGGEIMVPADNPRVITVGDLSPYSAQGPTVDGRMKPEILLEHSSASFSNGESSTGTSNAAAYFAGVVAVLKSYRPDLTRERIVSLPKKTVSEVMNPIQTVAMGEFAALHAEVLDVIEDLSFEVPVMAGRFNDGRYVLGIRRHPREVLGSYCRVSTDPSRHYEFYLAARRELGYPAAAGPQVLCFARQVGNGNNMPYPWQANTNNRFAFIEIRQVQQMGGSQPPVQGIWRTPSIQQLLN